MNRTLKRPMFRIGGSAGTGITSGLDQPRKQYANGRFMELVAELKNKVFLNKRQLRKLEEELYGKG